MFVCILYVNTLYCRLIISLILHGISNYIRIYQGIGIKGKEIELVWHEKASRTALQTSIVNLTHTLLVQTHNMITVKEIAEQSCQL